MAAENEAMNGAEDQARIERILLECLDAGPKQRADRLEDACHENPELAARLRERFQRLERLGFLPQDVTAELPETLGDYRIQGRLGRADRLYD